MSRRRRYLFIIMAVSAAIAAAVAYSLQTGPGPAAQAGDIMRPPDALAEARAGDRLLIDLRTPSEWRETGVPAPARLIDYNDTGGGAAFVRAVLDLVDGDKSRPLAVICATGGRSSRAWRDLKDAGFGNVRNVSEGVIGGRNGPGWLARELPTRRWSGDDAS